MPGVVCVLVMIEGFEVSMRSRMLPDSMRFGSFTIFCNPNSLIISSRRAGKRQLSASPPIPSATLATDAGLHSQVILSSYKLW